MIIEAVRDGIEDFQLMKMAEEVLGREAVLEYVRRITTDLYTFEKDAAILEQVKTELAQALLNATAQ
jgi:urease gamma subunit